ncbi:gag-pol polyprotein [Lasius niger]|uniref:Gag-pol polyprotein n=1 Tax=Lasius niger TaxID=67767 RepID=A0A0J7KLK3_LASNI|nr:gag-pol polyprotein [Lasius niger]
MANGLHTVWVQCPLNAAIKIANYGRVRIGWTSARLDLLGPRPTQCFKCWRFGHLKHARRSKEDFSKLCFRCGDGEHTASANGKAAIFCDLNLIRIKCRLAKQGRRYVAVYCGPYLMVSVYVSPSLDLRDFNTTLDKLSDVFSRVDKLIIGGDFNAKFCLWGSQLTDGNPYLTTCSQGSSIVDVTWISLDLLPIVKNWRVEEGKESLSDYLYISFILSTTRTRPPVKRLLDRRWNLKKFDKDFFLAVLAWNAYEPNVEDPLDVKQMATWLDQTMEVAYDAAAFFSMGNPA